MLSTLKTLFAAASRRALTFARSLLKYPAVEVAFIAAILLPILFILVVALIHSASLLAVEFGPLLHQVLLPGLMLLFAAAVPLVRTPIAALICLLGLFATSSLVYLLAGAEYFANVSFIVSIGGVAIIFLFVIMLLDPKGLTTPQKPLTFDLFYSASLLFGVALFFRLTGNVQTGLELHFATTTMSIPSEQDIFRAHMETDILLFRSLFAADWPLFALITGILLLSMLAAIIIATLSSEPHVERVKFVKEAKSTSGAEPAKKLEQAPYSQPYLGKSLPPDSAR